MTKIERNFNINAPLSILGKVGARLIARWNEEEADLAVSNTKERLEWMEQFKFLR